MSFSVEEKVAAQLATSNSALLRYSCLGDAQETKQHAFSAKPKASLAASALRLQLG
jgi:hypothetical protein